MRQSGINPKARTADLLGMSQGNKHFHEIMKKESFGDVIEEEEDNESGEDLDSDDLGDDIEADSKQKMFGFNSP